MDRELEDQIDQLFEKTITHLKVKVGRLIVRHEKKIIREYAKELKDSNSISSRPTPAKGKAVVKTSDRKTTTSRTKQKYRNESGTESDSGYYSE